MKISETSILSDQTPLLLCDSELCLATNDGNLSTVVLTSHLNRATVETKSQIKTFIDMRRFDDAWHLCKSINRSDLWYELGKAAIAELDINFGRVISFLLLLQKKRKPKQIECETNHLQSFCSNSSSSPNGECRGCVCAEGDFIG